MSDCAICQGDAVLACPECGELFCDEHFSTHVCELTMPDKTPACETCGRECSNPEERTLKNGEWYCSEACANPTFVTRQDKTPDEIWKETGDALAELERIGKGEPDKTPASALEGVELCERVALGMGWEFIERSSAYVMFCTGNRNRYIVLDPDSADVKSAFRPDLDGNHLAEVIAECQRRKWGWTMSGGTNLDYDYAGVHGHTCTGPGHAVAILRAFVAACEAEKTNVSESEAAS